METTDNHTPTPEELALCIEESARAGSRRLRAVARRAPGGRLRDRDDGQLQRLDRKGQEQEDLQRRGPHRGGPGERHGAPLPRLLPRGEAGHPLHRHRAGTPPRS